MNPFTYFSRPTKDWFYAGPASSFPNIDPTTDGADLSQPRRITCPGATAREESSGGSTPAAANSSNSYGQGCKAFNISREDGSQGKEVKVFSGALEWDEEGDGVGKEDLKDQVLVFRYKGKFHAVDHKCPHSSYPLSKGTPFDIEDFGMVLSAGLTCPKHGWSFDLFTGQSDRAAYILPIWQAEERSDGGVWVRRKPRLG